MPPPRRLADTLVLTLCGLLLLQGFVVAVFQVGGDSMAPTLHGRHRDCTCPRCGYPVQVGHGRGRNYRNAACPNCDFRPLPLDDATENPGDRVLVAQHVFHWRPPVRWEIVVLRWLGELLIKRVIGLPGESVEIRGGDIYIDGELARKTLAQARALRLPVFDSAYVPRPHTWKERWQLDHAGEAPVRGAELHLSNETGDWRRVTYRHFSLDAGKEQALGDEYACNGGEPMTINPVHDFLVECEVEIVAATGALRLGLTDGQDVAIAEIAINGDNETCLRVANEVLRRPESPFRLQVGQKYRLEFAFVDRRVTLAIDGREPFAAVDLPPATERKPVTRPLFLEVKNAQVVVRRLRLFRDLHYTSAGRNGVRGQVVRLGPEQYFVLGDNSPISQDSRSWPNGGRVEAEQLFGKPLWLPR